MARSIEKEVELLLKRQSKEMEKTPENELSLVERLEEELKKKKEEAKKALKEKEEAKAKKLGLEILKHYEVSDLDELKNAIISSEFIFEEDDNTTVYCDPKAELDSSAINEIVSWIPRLDAWEQDNWENRIEYKEFYPIANRLFKEIIKFTEKTNEGEGQNEGDYE